MSKEEAIKFLKCSGMSDEQIEAVVKAIEGPPVITNPSVKITGSVSIPIDTAFGVSSEYLANCVAHEIAANLASQLFPYIDFSLGHDNPDKETFYTEHIFEGSVNVELAPHNALDHIKNYFDFVHSQK